MKAFILFIFASAGLTACAQQKSELRTLDWLVGTWVRTNAKPGRSTYEKWERINDYEFIGSGINLKGTDTVFVEKLRIIERNDTLYYVADIPENKRLVYFRMTTLSKDGFVCENPLHDFPKKIAYTHTNEFLKAQISGDGKVIDYYFERKK
ncbi:MAG TPA: DUF6265 family protein [Cyclobacteriaceae bacterium]|nr:DUF6265 family protein [Cyclobacteriaceae bacterium]